ncbi:glycoside hydrolase family 3 C-terminal domain-containing protein [Parafrankia sp. EUN1f]|uniref:glycoside hydrolase family 3 C-terminal domain-containing protein n=1 Tax=Parafrankia sp. EUN1f TaxID=102897 RepID=UPI0001C45FD3|nr:glycoside hydrolase family 3 C-terminal domain-containing protein [Parafrankia sp. EUN1f]EFC81345.1 glycoside hydrolase family 3 domain protein [Parafrankia sp. EUN1f]
MPSIDPAGLPLDQKVSLLSGRDFWTTKPVEAAGIPPIVLTDGPHGIRLQRDGTDHLGFYDSLPATCLPPAVAVGSSWDVEVARRLGAAVGREARVLGVTVVLGPGVNIKRSPLCGRNFEYYSEDPLLTGMLGAAHVRGLQAQGVGASVKHFAANNQETDRMRVSADVDERTLREIYLAAFERIVTETRPATVMAAYNRINGTPASQHRWLLTDVLRGEWGFTGVVVSDWGGVNDRVAALAAGLDLQMPGTGGASDAEIVRAVRAGALDEAHVDAGARRVAALSGLVAEAGGELPVDEHHALARELATDCVVLLRNIGGVLPLARPSCIAVIGDLATSPRFQGGGSSRINPTRVDIPLDAIRALGESVTYARGYAADGTDDDQEAEAEAGSSDGSERGHGHGHDDREASLAQAVRIAAAADVAIVFAGIDKETEGVDREHIDLPAEQVALIRAVAAAAPRTVVVLAGGGVVSLEGWHDEVDAILAGWLLGQAAGGAIADVLFGVANPSGHLAETIPLRLADAPSYLNFPGEAGHVRYGEGVMVGYRGYQTVERTVRYPFGHGLSYTTFTTDALEVSLTGDNTATAHVTATNTGDRAGRHVIQVYVATAAGPVRRPVRELRAFKKITLRPGETRTVDLDLDRRAFTYYDIELRRWVVAPGDYTIQVGENAAHIVAERTITLTGDSGHRPLSLDSPFGDWLHHPVVGPQLRRSLGGGMTEQSRKALEQNPDLLESISSMPIRQVLSMGGTSFRDEELARLMELSR